jgi:hypothetical protein
MCTDWAVCHSEYSEESHVISQKRVKWLISQARYLAALGITGKLSSFYPCNPWFNSVFRSEQTGGAKAVVAQANGIGGGAADDNVVEQVNVHDFGRFAELARHLHVRGAGGWVPAYTAFGLTGIMPRT